MTRGTRSRTLLLVSVAVVAVVLAVGAGFLAQPRRLGALQGRSLAQEVLSQAPVPPGAVATDRVNRSLREPPSTDGCSPSWDLHKMYVLDSTTDVRAFVQSRVGKDASITGSGYSGGPGIPTVTFFTVTLASSPGSKPELLLYSTVPTGDRAAALRVDAEVTLPTSRCVTHGREVAVPDVVAHPISAAMRIIASAGFAPRRIQTELCERPVMPSYPNIGSVAEERPAASAYAKRGSTITLFEPTRSNPVCV
jgi:hypothetical protein